MVIVPTLSLFSFSVIAGAAGYASKPKVAAAAAKVVPVTSAPTNATAKPSNGGGALVEVDTPDGNPLGNLLGRNHGKEVCWISTGQLARVSAVYRTSTASVSVGGKSYSLVTVYDANEHDLRQVLASPVKCQLVQVAHVFFLPFDANLS